MNGGAFTKREVFDRLLNTGGLVRVQLIPKVDGTILPGDLLELPTVTLEYGLDLPRPIGFLNTTDEGITATLSFNATPVHTFVPWGAVYFVSQGNGGFIGLWPNPMIQINTASGGGDEAPPAKSARGKLRSV